MLNIALQLLLFLIALGIILLASIAYTRWLLDRMIGSKNRELEAITSTGTIPAAWSDKFDRRLIRMKETGKEARLERVRRKAGRTYVRRLSRLSEYVRRTRFVESEEVRKHVLRTLQRLDREWRASSDESVL
ncbi:hypothetical protein FHS19_003136 [Paenibacillus rhizosphaerae]|uniref:Uncharacterized protein n=1 Tax=Paenibacillus rhizosphaerae TaxID=297318 RepID=A0A839TP61_9BACL|nr:hypothetical protein [Paenibacillus rhizosphaerae]MBB3128482.1 hypothetical protein [Paenibacillus rhizosphaerae]